MQKPEELIRYTRQIQLDEVGLEGQRRLAQARVLCVGAGGLGSPLLLYLAAAGVGTLGIIDNDQVQLSNLHRQVLYSNRQIGRKKVTSAKKQLLDLNPHLQIKTYDQSLNPQNSRELIRCYDIVADCSDNFDTRYLINDSCFAEKRPFVSASILQWGGQCTVFLGENGPCYRCLFPQSLTSRNTLNCNQAGVLGVLPGLFGVIQATEILKWILKMGNLLTNQLLSIDIRTMQAKQFKYTQDPDCPLCVHRQFNFGYPWATQKSITVAELHELMQAGEKFLLLDVRTPEEYAQHNLGGLLIPLSELPHRITELDPKMLTIIYCQSGLRSQQAARILSAAQFRAVKYLAGGLKESKLNAA